MMLFCETLTSQQATLLDRQQLIDFLEWNDGNGCYSDFDCIMENLPLLTVEVALELTLAAVNEA